VDEVMSMEFNKEEESAEEIMNSEFKMNYPSNMYTE
jgi:hypothetical protein